MHPTYPIKCAYIEPRSGRVLAPASDAAALCAASAAAAICATDAAASSAAASRQGLTLVHFSPQRKRFLWDRGCIEGLFRGYFVGV